MAIININNLKQYFLTGLKPTQQQFWNLIDSFRHKNDPIPALEVDGLQDLLDQKLDAELYVDGFNVVRVMQVEETTPEIVGDGTVAVQFIEDDVVNLLFNAETSKYLIGLSEIINTSPLKIKLFNTTQKKTLIADVAAIATNQGQTKITLDPGALVADVEDGDVLKFEFDLGLKLINFAEDLKIYADTYKLPNNTLFRKIHITEVNQFAGVEIEITDNDFGKVFEFGIYDNLGARITSTGIQEIQKGKFIYPLEDYTLKPDVYYLGFFTNADNSNFAFSKYTPSQSSSLVSKLPNTKPVTSDGLGFVAYRLIQNKPNYLPSELEDYTDGTVRVLGINGSQPWAWNTTTGKMAYSVSSGATWIDMMPIDNTWGWSPIDLVTDGINLYVLMFDFTILKSSDMTATATWSNITPPNKNVDAKGFPYCLNIWNGYLYAGEYSGTLPLATPPKLHKMELSSGTWSVAKQFTNAKHIHAVQSPGSSVMYVVCGDQGYGDDVGIHRITQANQSTDTFQKVTAGETLPYPVNLEFVGSKIYGSGDQPPVHIISTRSIGSLGNFRLNPNNFKESTSEAGETCRAIKADTEGNLYYLAVETPTSHALYVSPPPYIHRFKISDVINDTGVNGRTVRSGDYFMNYEMRWKKVTFKFKN